MKWSIEESRKRSEAEKKKLANPEIVDLVRERDLTSIPNGKAYLVRGVHVYIDILNARELLQTDKSDSERSHKRYLRFLNLYVRACHTVFRNTDAAMRVDFQNARLHFVVFKPYDGQDTSREVARVQNAVAVANLVWRLLKAADELHEELPDVRVRIGIESGISLAVNNGTNGDREPLFIGEPANQAAKLLAGNQEGIYLGSQARSSMGAGWAASNPKQTPLTSGQIEDCETAAQLGIVMDSLLDAWEEELTEHRLSEISFSRPTPPLNQLEFGVLTPANSRRIEAISIYADIDGFTKYVREAIENGDAKGAIQALHVIRTELRNIIHQVFEGRKIRYIGDCMHAMIAVGAQATDVNATITQALLAAGAMRDAFAEIQEILPDTQVLGLAIGLEFGPLSITRLGVKGSRVRAAGGQAVYSSEAAQERCSGSETAVGEVMQKKLPEHFRDLFDTNGKSTQLTFNMVEAHIPEKAAEKAKLEVLQQVGGPVLVKSRAFAE